MKKLAFIAVFAAGFAVTACSGAEEAAPVAQETTTAPAAVAVMAADGQAPAGTFEITSADGEVMTQTVNADGTYSNTDAEGTVTTGTWTLDQPDNWCSKLDTEEAVNCFTETVGPDGTWSSVNVNDPEDSSTIVRMS